MSPLRSSRRRPDETANRVEAQVRARVEKALADFQESLEHALSRARADSLSQLADEERRIAEERRRVIADREAHASAELFARLTDEQKKLEQRLAGWAADLDRAQRALGEQVAAIEARQRELLAGLEARIEADADRVEPVIVEARAAAAKVREDVEARVREALQGAGAEIESHAADRRRALHEVAERLRRRERALAEQIEREENEATLRIAARFEDVERRQVEAVQRAVERESARFAELAAHEFSTIVRAAREDAARRLARELDRAVEQFSRHAELELAERLAKVADSGGQKIERRLQEATSALEAHQQTLAALLERAVGEAEAGFRERLDRAVTQIEAERGSVEARLRELSRRFDETRR